MIPLWHRCRTGARVMSRHAPRDDTSANIEQYENFLLLEYKLQAQSLCYKEYLQTLGQLLNDLYILPWSLSLKPFVFLIEK